MRCLARRSESVAAGKSARVLRFLDDGADWSAASWASASATTTLSCFISPTSSGLVRCWIVRYRFWVDLSLPGDELRTVGDRFELSLAMLLFNINTESVVSGLAIETDAHENYKARTYRRDRASKSEDAKDVVSLRRPVSSPPEDESSS